MKKFILIFAIVILSVFGGYPNAGVYAEDGTPTIEGAVQFDWINMEQVKRDEKIDMFRTELFGDEKKFNIKKKDFRELYKDYLKDLEVKTHYRLISNGAKETKDYNMSGFFKKFKGDELLYAYALQPKSDLRHVYYYTAFGSLAYVDDISENYPNFPYNSKQYRANGQLAGAIHFESADLQYIYKPNGKFIGVWYKDKMFDKNGKEIMTRTNW